MLRRQDVHRLADGAAVVGDDGREGRVVGVAHAWQRFLFVGRRGQRFVAEAAAVAPALIDRAVAGDAEEPRDELAAAQVELLGLAPEPQEDVLRHVLGDVAVADDAQHDGVDEVAIAIVQMFEGVEVARTEAFH